MTAGEALADLDDDEDKEPLFLKNGKYAHLLPLVPPGENYLFFTAKRGYPTPIFAYRSRFSDFLYKANSENPIKTLIARPGKYTGPFHWDSRCFTVREYMRLQGFPDHYQFVGNRDDAIKQIGNSVSPKLAKQLAIAIAAQIFDRPSDLRLLPVDKKLSFDERKGAKAKRTKERHDNVARQIIETAEGPFVFDPFEATVLPATTAPGQPNVKVTAEGRRVQLTVRADSSRKIFAKMKLHIHLHKKLDRTLENFDAVVEVVAYGDSEHTIQTMWNAVDLWVIRSSKFHSLFELYGHFTEPHPIFEIVEFQAYSKHPIAEFAKHVSNFKNCSRYFPRKHLTELFGVSFKKSRFIDLVRTLRSYRFDIRCHETNIAIGNDVYMVSYPFTLPFGKQMNFSVRERRIMGEAFDLNTDIVAV